MTTEADLRREDDIDASEAVSNGDETFDLVRSGANLPAEFYSDQRIRTIRAYVAAGKRVTISDLSAFLAICHRYDLDPLMREIWLVEDKGRLMAMTGRDAFVKAATKEDGFRGIEQGVVREKDEFKIVRSKHDAYAEHVISGITAEQRGAVVGAYCIALHEKRAPVVIVRAVADYQHLMGKLNWKNYLEDMIETRAITAALRRQFSLTGIVADHELAEEGAQAAAATDKRQAALADELRDMSDDNAEETESAEPASIEEPEFEVVEKESPSKNGEIEQTDLLTPDDKKETVIADLTVPQLRRKITYRFKLICADVDVTDDKEIDVLRRDILGAVSGFDREKAESTCEQLDRDREEFIELIKSKTK